MTEEEITYFKEYLTTNRQALVDSITEGYHETAVQIAALNEVFTPKTWEDFSKEEQEALRKIWVSHILIPKEIVETEKTYLTSLKSYLEATKDAKYETNNALQVQRAEITKIIELSEKFLLLTQTSENPPKPKLPTPDEIAEFFNTNAEAFKVYQNYATHYDHYQKLIDYEALQITLPTPTPGELTILPIQRVTRYQLLLKELLKNTALEKDQKPVSQSLEIIEQTNRNINNLRSPQEQLKFLKKTQRFIDKYIEEIKKIPTNNLKEREHWQEEISLLENRHKALNNPDSPEAQIMITARSDQELIELIHASILSRLDVLVGNNGVYVQKIASELNLETLKNNILEYFSLIFEKPVYVLELPVYAEIPKPTETGLGAAFLLSKIAGKAKDPGWSKNFMEKSIQKDCIQMVSLYKNELSNMIKKEKNIQQKNYLIALSNNLRADFDVDEIQEFLKQYSKQEKIFATALSSFILTKTFKDPNLLLEKYEYLNTTVCRKFLEMHAPAVNQEYIAQLNKYIEKLETNFTNLQNKLNGKAPDLVQVGIQNRLEEKLKNAKAMQTYLIDPDPVTLPNNVTEIRKIHATLSKPDSQKDELNTIIDQMLKLSDPYYNEIKKLDKYIAALEKDLVNRPQDDNIPLGPKESDRNKKKEIAQNVRAYLLNFSIKDPNIEKPQDPETNKPITLSTRLIDRAITQNTSVTHTFIGKGRLDGILKEILHNLEPKSPQKTRRPK